MVTTATVNDPDTKLWNQQLAELQARYKHVRPAILAALCVLQQEPNVSVDDAKARAAARGTRITAASVNAARTLLERMDSQPVASASPKSSASRAPRRARTTEIPFDVEAFVRGVVAKMQAQGNAEAERLRDAMRKAIGVLQAAAGA